MATYNGEKYLHEQIDSILRQTVKPTEIVICDDCSTDNTWDILQQYASMDSRFHIYRNDQNLGFGGNFEKAISLCHGDYIALSDQDDIWVDNHIELLYNGLGNKMMSCGNALLVDENGNSLGTTWKEMEQLDYIPDDDFLKLKSIILFRNPFQGASMLFRKELIMYALPFPQGTLFHDRWFAMVAAATGGINYINEILLNYRRTQQNVTVDRIKRNRIKTVTHGWAPRSTDDVDNLMERTKLLMSPSQIKEIHRWRYYIKNNTLWRKPITILFLLKDYKNIYSYSFK